jgi:hypothetical protein
MKLGFALEFWIASVVYWSEFLAKDPEVLGSIPADKKLSGEVVGLERGPFSQYN